jgi:hypothetical protein
MTVGKATDRSAWWVALVGVIGAIAGAGITGLTGYLGQKDSTDEKLIELSINILQSVPKQETTPLRDWAISTLEKRAKFTFTDEQKKLLENQSLPHVAPLYPAPSLPPGVNPLGSGF